MGGDTDIGTRDVAERTGISLRQLNHWDQLGIIGPSTQPALGSGTRRRYTRHDVFLLLIAGALRSAHTPLDFVREVVSSVRLAGLDLDCPDPTLLVGVPDSVVYLGGDVRRAMEAALGGKVAYIVNVAVHAQRAARITSRVALPGTRLMNVGGRVVQCIVSPRQQGYTARCNAFPGCHGSGDSPEEAAEALRVAIEETAPVATRQLQRGSRSMSASVRDGASSWGGDW